MPFLSRLWRTELVVLAALVDLALGIGLFLAWNDHASGSIFTSTWGAFGVGVLATLAMGVVPALVGGALHAFLSWKGWMRWWLSIVLGAALASVFLVSDPTLGMIAMAAGATVAGLAHWGVSRIIRA